MGSGSIPHLDCVDNLLALVALVALVAEEELDEVRGGLSNKGQSRREPLQGTLQKKDKRVAQILRC